MPRRIRSPQLETRTARLKLSVRRKPYYTPTLAPGIKLGYRRNNGPGSWSVRAVGGGADWVKRLGLADDHEAADGEHVLDYAQAQDRARALARGTEGGNRPATVAEAVGHYAADLRARGGDPANASRVRGHLTPTLAAKAVGLLGARELRQWRDGLVAKGLEPASAGRVACALKAALNLAAKDDPRITNGAAWRTGLARLPDSERARNVVLPDDTIRDLVAAAYDFSRDLGLFVELAAVTGARTSQLLRIEVGDLQDHGDEPRVLIPCSRKGRRRRSERRPSPIPPPLAAALRQAAAGRPADAPLLISPAPIPGRPFARLVAGLGLEPTVTLYALRHSSVTRMLLASVPVRVVASTHDTSVAQVEKAYSRYISDHSDALVRGALLQVEKPPAAGNVVPLKG